MHNFLAYFCGGNFLVLTSNSLVLQFHLNHVKLMETEILISYFRQTHGTSWLRDEDGVGIPENWVLKQLSHCCCKACYHELQYKFNKDAQTCRLLVHQFLWLLRACIIIWRPSISELYHWYKFQLLLCWQFL